MGKQILNGIVYGIQQVQSDWEQTDNTKPDYIKNKPIPVTDVEVDGVSVVTDGVAEIDLTDYAKSADLGTAAAKNYTASVTQSSTDLVTSGAVWTAIDNLPEPMVFKGTLGTGGTITTLPTASASNEGDTYKVITAGTYAGQSAKVGDVFVSNGSEWVLIPAGDTDSDTWRAIKVNGTQLLGSAISTGAVNFKSGTNAQVSGSGNDVSVDVDTTFTEASTRTNIASGDSIKTILGKIKKFFTDLKAVAFSGSYNDLSDQPTIPTVGDGTITITQNGTTIGDFSMNQSGDETIALTDEKVKITSTNPASTTTYYPTWVDSSGTKGENINNGFAYQSRNGTTSQDGVAVVQAGNAIASGTANNKKGYFRVYNKNSNYATIGYNDSASSNTTHTLPATGGTIVNNNTFRSQATVNTTQNGLMIAADKIKLDNLDNTKDVDKNVNSATKLTKTETVLQTNQVPYVSRASLSPEGFSGYIREKIIGGSIAWNQKIPKTATTTTYAGITFTNNNDGSWTLTGTASNNNSFKNIQTTTRTLNFLPNHVYFVSAKSGNDKVGLAIMQNNLSNWTSKYIYNTESIVKISDYTISDTSSYGCWARLQVSNALNEDIGTCTYYPMIVDLTLMFGTAIADYIYSLETATAGAGVNYLKSLGLFTKPYYEYDNGSIQSVCVKEKKITTGTHIDTIPLSTSELRGIPKLDSNNNVYFDGDEYTSDGKIKRKYGIVDLGTRTWYSLSTNTFYATLPTAYSPISTSYIANALCQKYTITRRSNIESADKSLSINKSDTVYVCIHDSAYTDAATFKTSVDGVYLVYELATPTEENVSSYQNPQYANGGTEEFVDGKTRDMIVPVGHVTEYMGTTAGEYQVMPTMPVDDRKYVLTADNHEVVWERKGWKFYKEAFSNMNIDNFILLNADEIMLVAHWERTGGITYNDTKIVPVSYLLESVYFYSGMGFYGNENTNCFVEIDGYFNADNNDSGITFSGWTIDSGAISNAYFRLYYR